MNYTTRISTLIITILLAGGGNLCAQPFQKALGIRLGYPLSVSYKQFVSEKNAFEVYAGFRGYKESQGLSLNGAYLVHNDITGLRGLQFYFGGGAGVHFWSYDRYDRGNTTSSISGYLGLQYVFADLPISLTADWIPTYFLGEHRNGRFRNFGSDVGGLGIRYNF
jgi:hypothetical protein